MVLDISSGRRVRPPPPPPPKKVPPKPASSSRAPTAASSRTSSATSAPTPARETRPQTTLTTARDGRARFAADSGIDYRRAALLSQVPGTNRGASPSPWGGPGGFQQVDADPSVAAARRSYEALSDRATLRTRLEAEPNLSRWEDRDLHALAAVAIDFPEHEEAISGAVANTVQSAESLADLPENAGFQYLLERHVIEGDEYGARGHLGTLVNDDLSAMFDGAVEGASGDDKLDAAVQEFSGDVQGLVEAYPAVFPVIEREFAEVIEQDAGRIQDIQRGDDPWYANVGHAVTDGIRGSASWLADQFFPKPPAGGPGRIVGIPGADFLNSDTGRALREVGIGVSISGRGAIEGPAQAITDPVGTARALYETVKNPSLLLEGYRQIAEEHGPNAAVGAVGFDLLLGITTAEAGAALGSAGRVGTVARLIDRLPGPVRRILPGGDIIDDLRRRDGFDDLDSPIRDLAMDRALRLDRGGARTIGRIVENDGFQALDAAQQDRLLRLAGSQDPYIGAPGRRSLDRLLGSSELRNLTPDQQARRLERFLADQPGTPHSPLAADGTYRPRTEWDVNGEPALGNFEFSNGATMSLTRNLEIDGRTIEIVTPPGDGTFPDLNRVANAVAALPREARDRITRVVMEPEANPYDAIRQQRTGEDFVTGMTADVDGTVRVYPSMNDAPFDAFADVLTHETGHLLSFDALGPNRFDDNLAAAGGSGQVYEGAGWDRWREASENDGIRSSQYAATDVGEDFAETYRLYVSSQGTPWGLELRALMPERFEILDELSRGNA